VGLGQGQQRGPLQAPGPAEVNALDGGGQPEPGRLEHALQAAVLALGELPVNQHAEALLEAQGVVVGMLALFDESPGHARQVKRVQAVQGGVGEHRSSFHW
jgi:hypothetical protein